MISPGNTQLPAVISLLPSVSSMLLLAPTTLPGSPGGQCDPCPAASCVCLCEQVPRTVPPTLKPPSGASTREAAERCSEHRLDGSAGCPAPQLSSAHWVCQQYQTAFPGQRDIFSDSYSSSFPRNLHPAHRWADSADYRTKMA